MSNVKVIDMPEEERPVEKLLISSGHKMKNISCFIQILVHTPPFLKLANE